MPQNDISLLTWTLDKLWVVLFFMFGWLLKKTSENNKSTVVVQQNLDSHKEKLAEKYTPKSDFQNFKKEIFNRFDRLEDLIRDK